MSKFNVGESCKVIKYINTNNEIVTNPTIGTIITIRSISDGVKFPYYCSDGISRKEEELQEISLQHKPLTNTIITNITSPEQHKRVQEKLFGMGCNWCDGSQDVKYTGSTHICIEDGGVRISFWGNQSSESAIKSSGCKTIIPASEFLGEGEQKQYIFFEPGTINEELLEIKPFHFDRPLPRLIYTKEEKLESLNKLYNNPTSEPRVAKENKIMENIVSFFNDLTVSAEDKELRKAGLKDENLSWAGSALEIIKNLEAKERGYKDWDDLRSTFCNDASQGRLSFLEEETLYKKFYTKLLETAKKFNRKDEKKK